MPKEQTVLFHETVFGPIHSRRLGVSLGINLLPNDGKICSFDCVYCEAGYNAQGQGKDGVARRDTLKRQLRAKLKQMRENGEPLNTITFSGNGEPTIHPQFKDIVHDVVTLRNEYYPEAKISVLSNSTMAGRPQVAAALKMVDNNILKLDSAIDSTFLAINQPVNHNVLPAGVIADLKQFSGQCVIQTMLLRGSHGTHKIDNTTDAEIEALIEAYLEINPREVMIYGIDRTTPEENLEKVSKEELEAIGKRIAAAGLKVQVNA